MQMIRSEEIDGCRYELYLDGDIATFIIRDLDCDQVVPIAVKGPLAVVEARFEQALEAAA